MDIDILLTKDANLLRALQSSDTNEGDQDYIAPGTIFFVALAACFLWCCGPSILGYLKKCCLRITGDGNQSSQDQRPSAGDPSQDAEQATLTEDHRRIMINTFLQTKKYEPIKSLDTNSATVDATTSSVSNGEDEANVSADTVKETECKSETPAEASSKTQIYLQDREYDLDGEATADCCVICLTAYEEGDEIAWSQNPKCTHLFHRECIMEWLLKRDDCPICRHNFFFDDESNNHECDNNNSNYMSGVENRSPAFRAAELFLEDVSETGSDLPDQLLRGLELLHRAQENLEQSASRLASLYLQGDLSGDAERLDEPISSPDESGRTIGTNVTLEMVPPESALATSVGSSGGAGEPAPTVSDPEIENARDASA